MIRANLQRPQIECNQDVLGRYFSDTTIPSMESIMQSIGDIIASHAPNKVYIGITYHPCGRYTGFYERTTTLPDSMGTEYNSDTDEIEDLNEVAHNMIYSKMYVFCAMDSQNDARDLEESVIAEARKQYPEWIRNASDGREGPEVDAPWYFLYVCVSRMV